MIEKQKENNLPKLRLRTFLVPSVGAALFYFISFVVVNVSILILGTELAIQYYGAIVLISSIIMCISFLLLLIIIEKRDNQRIFRLLPTVRGSFAAIVISLGLLGFSFFYMSFIQSLSYQNAYVKELFDDYALMMSYADNMTLTQLVFSNLSSVFFVPIAEELLFRGIMLQEFLRSMKPAVAIILSSTLFALMHFQPIQIGYAFICGIIIGMAYYYSKSIYLTIIIHIVFNFFGSTFYRIFSSSNEIMTMKVAFETIALFTMFIALIYIKSEGKKRFWDGAR